MVLYAAWMLDQGLEARDHIAMVRAQCAEILGRAVDRGVQILARCAFATSCQSSAIIKPLRAKIRFSNVYRIHKSRHHPRAF